MFKVHFYMMFMKRLSVLMTLLSVMLIVSCTSAFYFTPHFNYNEVVKLNTLKINSLLLGPTVSLVDVHQTGQSTFSYNFSVNGMGNVMTARIFSSTRANAVDSTMNIGRVNRGMNSISVNYQNLMNIGFNPNARNTVWYIEVCNERAVCSNSQRLAVTN